MKLTRLSILDLGVILIASVLYYLLISQYIGAVDDIMYRYMRIDGHIRWDIPVNSFSDAILSQSEDYFSRNGRFLVHTIVQYLCGMSWGKYVFFLLSTIVFGLFLAGLIKIIKCINNGRCQPVFVFVLLMTLVPIPGQTLMGNMSFTLNYLWTSTASVWILYLYNLARIKQLKFSGWHKYAIFPFFFIAGCMHEGFSLPISGFMLLAICLDKKCRTKIILSISITYWMGTIITAFSPANFLRSAEASYLAGYGQSFIQKTIFVFTGLIGNEYLVWIFIISSVIVVWNRRHNPQYFNQYLPYITVGALALAFDIFVAYVGPHQLTPVALMGTIIVGAMGSSFKISYHKPVLEVINSGFAILIAFFWLNAFELRRELTEAWTEMHEKAATTNEEYAYGDKLLAIIGNNPSHILRFTSSRDAMLHVQNNHWFETLTSVLATGGG